jgi:hypothetical protein
VNATFVILSGIDQVNLLQAGTEAEVRAVTRTTIETGKPGGGFIMQPVDFLEYGTPVENVAAYVETAPECAGY